MRNMRNGVIISGFVFSLLAIILTGAAVWFHVYRHRSEGHNKLNHHNLVVSSRLGNSSAQATVTSRGACMGVCLLSLRFIDS